jgi:hypothetical protein
MNNEEDFNILGWWKSNAERFPGLSKLVKVLLMIPMTSVALESAFSTGGRVINNHRTWLNDETVEAVICAQDWLKSGKHNMYCFSGLGWVILDFSFFSFLICSSPYFHCN